MRPAPAPVQQSSAPEGQLVISTWENKRCGWLGNRLNKRQLAAHAQRRTPPHCHTTAT
eukprot:CAMPEP_0171068386 /NCGR_PEP_ID=MMETSP0766_2-20121228/8535_1 /TAXON_ID=439317 /ORGANISM="Gambierdiscus australes, Strain CAWD 149" /LENGTH=57 /DNA_ID=CAMNT_0011524695 /DNA_START=63 /DNA_END=232 /DNA_ORIENTATION=+